MYDELQNFRKMNVASFQTFDEFLKWEGVALVVISFMRQGVMPQHNNYYSFWGN